MEAWWDEYDSVAEWCAKRGHSGYIREPLPANISAEVMAEINKHPEEFQQRIRDMAYELAMKC